MKGVRLGEEPPESLLSAMARVISSLIEKIIANSIQTRALAPVRDTLRFDLLSGRLRVKDITCFLENVS